MALIINEEQQMLKTSAKQFLVERAPVEALRQLRDTRDEKGYSPALWATMAEMGWTGLNIPEAYGGLDFGYVGLGQILEEMGKTLTASPMMSTVVLGASLINAVDNVVHKEAILPAIAEGSLVLAVAIEESNMHRPFQIESKATTTTDGYSISGKKRFVLDGHVADKMIVSALLDGEFALFLVDCTAEGCTVERHIMMDSRNAATVSLNGVKVAETNLIEKGPKAKLLLEHSLDVARICLSAELLGSMQEAFDRTIAYLKERHQFGVPIGSFQGLQHRAADMYSEIELCKSMVLKGLQAIDAGGENLPKMASMIKTKVSEIAKLVTNEAIQMYGGIGMTDDEEIGFFMKRARVAQRTFGDYNYHIDRFASLNGF